MLRRFVNLKNVLRPVICVACTLTGAAWLVWQGPMPVLRGITPMPEMAPFWYMLLAFPVLGLLVADLVDLSRNRGFSPPTFELAAQIALIVGLSSARLGALLPLSGHALLFSYFVFRRLLVGTASRGQSVAEVWLAAGCLAATAYPKLFWWDDPATLVAGIAIGVLFAGFSGWFSWFTARRSASGP